MPRPCVVWEKELNSISSLLHTHRPFQPMRWFLWEKGGEEKASEGESKVIIIQIGG